MRVSFSQLLLALTPARASAQFPPTPTGLTVVKSTVDPRVTISWKETDICEQPAGSKTYSGYVHLPRSVLKDTGIDEDINTYFLYFEAQHSPSTAPLAIWLSGGPGAASTFSAFDGANSPCYANPWGNGTVKSDYSFNQRANVMYVDQPVMAGFSYNQLLNASSDGIAWHPLKDGKIPKNAFAIGTVSTQKRHDTAYTTPEAARMLWHFAEHWLSSFPKYTSTSNDIGIWGNSYGGMWAPEVAARFDRNLKALPPTHPCKKRRIDNIGITNGCIDTATQAPGWPDVAYNNTYDHPFGTEEIYEASIHNITKANGLLDRIKHCRSLGAIGDPDSLARNETVNLACMDAFNYFVDNVKNSFPKMNKRFPFNFAFTYEQQKCTSGWTPIITYLKDPNTQQSLGVPLNFTDSSLIVLTNFGWINFVGTSLEMPVAKQSGDFVRQDGLANFEYLLSNGIKVALIYGDIDFQCPWMGAEKTALAAEWPGQASFADAGYERLQGVDQEGLDHGALIKQAGLMSFSRVLRAGHSTGGYAPATVAAIFERTFDGMDAATGDVAASKGYKSTGPKSSLGFREEYPKDLPASCEVNGRYRWPRDGNGPRLPG